MTILVTGGAGYIGSHIVLELLNAGQNVVVLDDLSVGRMASLENDAPFYMGDIGDTGLVSRIIHAHDIKAIIHMAAVTSVPLSIENPDHTYTTNVTKSKDFLETAINAGVCRFVFSSVSAVYGEPTTHKVKEDHPLKPHTPYGDSKAQFESILKEKAEKHKDFTYAIVRCFNVAGVDKEHRVPQWPDTPTHLVKLTALASIGLKDNVMINGTDYDTLDGTCIRDYIHVTDAAHGHILALKYIRTGNPSIVVNLGSGQGTSVKEVIDTAAKISGKEIIIISSDRRIGDPTSIISDNSLAEEKLKWKPRLSTIEEIMLSAIEWEKVAISQPRDLE